MPNKTYHSQHWKITVKLPQINNTDIDSDYDVKQAKKQLLDELNILLEDSVLPEFNRVVIKQQTLPE